MWHVCSRAVTQTAVALAATAMFAAGCAAPSRYVAGSGAASSRSAPIGVPTVNATAGENQQAVLQAISAALVSADGLHITVNGRGGGAVASLSLSAHATATTVTLSLRAVPAVCPCTANLIREPVRTTLTASLGDRRLVDAARGKAVTSLSGAELARVAWLPIGFETTPTDALTSLGDGGPTGWARSYAETDPANSNVITITQYRGDRMSDPQLSYPAAQSLDVNGHDGCTWHEGGTDQGYAIQIVGRHVVWQQDGYTFDVAASLTRVLPGQTAVRQDDLLRVARSLATPN